MAAALSKACRLIVGNHAFYEPADYVEHKTSQFRLYLLVWRLCAAIVLRCVPNRSRAFRGMVLQSFGASLDRTAMIYSNCRIYAPCNLSMGPRSCLGPRVDCYNPGQITIGADVTVSQDAFLCTASHDIDDAGRRLVTKPIRIDDGAWVFARAIVLPGVTIGTGAVVAAGAVVTKDVDAFTVVGGNPATVIRQRNYRGKA